MYAGVAEADSVVLMVDGQIGLQPGDREILDWLRRNHPNKPVTVAVNKCESTAKADLQVRFKTIARGCINGTVNMHRFQQIHLRTQWLESSRGRCTAWKLWSALYCMLFNVCERKAQCGFASTPLKGSLGASGMHALGCITDSTDSTKLYSWQHFMNFTMGCGEGGALRKSASMSWTHLSALLSAVTPCLLFFLTGCRVLGARSDTTSGLCYQWYWDWRDDGGPHVHPAGTQGPRRGRR